MKQIKICFKYIILLTGRRISMQTIHKTIKINKPNIFGKEKLSFKDWGIYRETYILPLQEKLNMVFSNVYTDLCEKENKKLGRTSWYDVNIKPDTKQFMFIMWDIGDIPKERSIAFLGGAGLSLDDSEIAYKLIVDIEWT
jgi:hypothetical protein